MKIIHKNWPFKTNRRLNTEKRAFLIPSALIFLLIFMFTAFNACTQSSSVLSFTEKDNGSSISMDKGQRFEIKLESNMTTGYSWQLPEDAGGKVVSMVSSEYIETEKDKEMVGAGGVETFIFEAKEAGQVEIMLEYVRPWEENTEPEKVFKIKVTVQ